MARFRTQVLAGLLALSLVPAGTAAASARDRREAAVLKHLSQLPNVGLGDYLADPYLRCAVELQGLGPQAAARLLSRFSHRNPYYDDCRVIVLCRMLFVGKGKRLLRAPILGSSGFLGGTREADWPKSPITVVGGVPFLVARDFRADVPETGPDYVTYCLTSGRWSTSKLKPYSREHLVAALRTLLWSPKWRTRLSPDEQAFLRRQVD